MLLFGKLPPGSAKNEGTESSYYNDDLSNDIDSAIITTDSISSSFSQLEHLYDLLKYLEKHKSKLKYMWKLIEKMFDSQSSNVTFSDEEINAVAVEVKVSLHIYFYSFNDILYCI